MNRTLFKTLVAGMWLFLPLTALRFWLVWDRLPASMATHFNAHWQPNGWMPRETALYFALGLITFMLAVFTVILVIMLKTRSTPAVLRYGFLAFSYLVVGFVFYGNSKVVSYNLGEGSASLGPAMLLIPLALVLLIALYVGVKRGAPLPSSDLIAEEVHRSPFFALVILAPVIIILAVLSNGNAKPILPVFVPVVVIALFAAAAAASGFHYIITHHGLEIRALGFRLRSIPANEIVRYAPGTWPLWRGFGIRGLGSTRGYVWGNRGVWIDTPQDHVFLGFNHPDSLIRDLEMIKQSAR
jgi:hypothetical protein